MSSALSGGEFVKIRRTFFVERRDAFLRFRRVVEHLHRVEGEVTDAANIIGIRVERPLRQRNGRR